MPIQQGRDPVGWWFRWGRRGKKYYYINGDMESMLAAFEKAEKQARAIFARRNTV